MKKLIVFLAELGLGLILIGGNSENSLAEYKGSVLKKDTLLSSSVIKSQTQKDKVKKNFIYQKAGSANPGKVAGEFLLGGSGAILLGVGGGLAGYALAHDGSSDYLIIDESGAYGALIGYLITSNLGCALGVYLIGDIGEDNGSFAATLGGSAVGTLAGCGLVYLMVGSSENDEMTVPVFVFFTVAQSAGATLAFNLSRKKKVEVSSGALLNLNDGKLSLAFPQVNLTQDLNYKINLFQAKF
jgi:hypothetical protein